jgi:hypothetical protein
MRYFYEKKKDYTTFYGEIYYCDHPVYNSCTLFKIHERGLAVIQQRFDDRTKSTYWTSVDSYLWDDLYKNINFYKFFDARSDICKDGLYPTVTIRQIMWALKMKPLKKERWETTFDRKDI